VGAVLSPGVGKGDNNFCNCIVSWLSHFKNPLVILATPLHINKVSTHSVRLNFVVLVDRPSLTTVIQAQAPCNETFFVNEIFCLLTA
jgi:hypothetical protein